MSEPAPASLSVVADPWSTPSADSSSSTSNASIGNRKTRSHRRCADPRSEASRGSRTSSWPPSRLKNLPRKSSAIALYERILALDPSYAPAYINLGTIHFHLRQYARAEELYRRATETDSTYVLAFFDLGNVLDELERPEESVAAYLQAVAVAPRYADAHYNLALAYERKGQLRPALRHWEAYARLDKSGPWAEHARGRIRRLLEREKLTIAWRAEGFVPPSNVRRSPGTGPPRAIPKLNFDHFRLQILPGWHIAGRCATPPTPKRGYPAHNFELKLESNRGDARSCIRGWPPRKDTSTE